MNELSFVRDLNLQLIAILRDELGFRGTERVRWLMEKRKPRVLEASVVNVVEACTRTIWNAANTRKAVAVLRSGVGKVLYWHPGQLYFPGRFLSRYGLVANTVLFQDIVSQMCFMEPSFKDHILKKPLFWASELLDRAALLCSLEAWVARGAVLFYPPLTLWAPILDLAEIDKAWVSKMTQEELNELKRRGLIEWTLRNNMKILALEAMNRTPDFLNMADSEWEEAAISQTAKVLSVPEDEVRFAAKLRPLVAPLKRLALYGKEASFIGLTTLTVGQALFLGALWGCVPLSDSPQIRLTLDLASKYGIKITASSAPMTTPSLDFLNDVPIDFALGLRPETQALRDELYRGSEDPESFMRGYERFRQGWNEALDAATLKFGLRGALGFGTLVHGALELNSVNAMSGACLMAEAFVSAQNPHGELTRNPYYVLWKAEQKAIEHRRN